MHERRPAFTLLELLVVVAVIGLLAALIFPSVRTARMAALKARTKVQFNQWAAAMEGFRAEYGYYPVLDGSNLVNPPGQSGDPATVHLFHDILAGRRRDGSPLPQFVAGADARMPEAQNRKQMCFHPFSSVELAGSASGDPQLVRDAFGNAEIAVLVDRDMDGFIKAGSDFAVLPTVSSSMPSGFPASGVRAGVIFYSAVPGHTTGDMDFICSWQ